MLILELHKLHKIDKSSFCFPDQDCNVDIMHYAKRERAHIFSTRVSFACALRNYFNTLKKIRVTLTQQTQAYNLWGIDHHSYIYCITRCIHRIKRFLKLSYIYTQLLNISTKLFFAFGSWLIDLTEFSWSYFGIRWASRVINDDWISSKWSLKSFTIQVTIHLRIAKKHLFCKLILSLWLTDIVISPRWLTTCFYSARQLPNPHSLGPRAVMNNPSLHSSLPLSSHRSDGRDSKPSEETDSSLSHLFSSLLHHLLQWSHSPLFAFIHNIQCLLSLHSLCFCFFPIYTDFTSIFPVITFWPQMFSQ